MIFEWQILEILFTTEGTEIKDAAAFALFFQHKWYLFINTGLFKKMQFNILLFGDIISL